MYKILMITSILTLTLSSTSVTNQGFTITKVNINQQGSFIQVSNGGAVQLEFEYQVWTDNQCPDCEVVLVLGIDNQSLECIYAGKSGIYPGTSGKVSKTITISNQVREYRLSVKQYSGITCQEAENSFLGSSGKKEIGAIDVGSQISLQSFNSYEMQSLGSSGNFNSNQSQYQLSSRLQNKMGFSTGGAKDINNFRENIFNGFLPLPTDVTYEGLFYDYYFDTGNDDVCEGLFCPSYISEISPDPLTGNLEYFLSVGLNSGISEADFARKKLNLVVVLDKSGSMSSAFNKYYYDQSGNRKDPEYPKIKVAAESIAAMLKHLNEDDRFGMVVFDNQSSIIEKLKPVTAKNIRSIKNRVYEISAGGGTNLSSGMSAATNMLKNLSDSDPEEYENRIIFLTDAMPNRGDITVNGFYDYCRENAYKGVYTTFIGIGVDFNTELIEQLTKIRGANYYAVHNSQEFKTRMDDEFELMVTPLVFNLQMTVQAEGFKIKKVYGSPEADLASDEIMVIKTLFPSSSKDGEVKGGLVLLQLEKTGDNPKLTLRVSYEDRNGNFDAQESVVVFNSSPGENTGIKKGILLSRYANLLKNWMIAERSNIDDTKYDFKLTCYPPQLDYQLGRWERQSVDLHVSEQFRQTMLLFQTYFKDASSQLNDESLSEELKVLEQIVKFES